MEILISLLICTFIFFNLIVYRAEANCGNVKTWLLWSLFFYVLDTIQCMNQLMHIKKSGRESIWLMLAMYLILMGNTGWYIYGNIIYYQNGVSCTTATNPD